MASRLSTENLPGLGRKLWSAGMRSALAGGVLSLLLLAAQAWFAARADLSERGESIARIASPGLAQALASTDPIAATERLAGLASSPEITAAVVLLQDGQSFAHYLRPGGGLLVPPDMPVDNPAAGSHFDGRWLRVIQPVEPGSASGGIVILTLDALPAFGRAALSIGILILVVLGGLMVFGWLLRRQLAVALAPAARLLDSVRLAAADPDYSQRTRIPEADEIGELSRSFDALMDMIQDRERALNHELDERRRAEGQIERVALYDTLTGLPNRQYLRVNGNRIMAVGRGGASAVLCLGVDNFKRINDHFSHEGGDEVLRSAAERLRLALRPEDLLARFGGDEFMVKLNSLHSERYALMIADKLRKALATPFVIEGREVAVRASIGIALSPQHGRRLDELLHRAAAAMSRVKAGGKDDVLIWDDRISEHATTLFNLESGLREALSRSLIDVDYQPIVTLADGRVTGMEALVRWRHPERGTISPAEFIPIAEDTGLILPIGLRVLELACTQAAAWQRDYGPLLLAVNVSARQFRDPQFARNVGAVCRRTGFPFENLELEVTESTVMHDTEHTGRIMHSLVAQGLRLSLDDFGTGFSSLAYLKSFPLSKLKIDRRFVAGLPHDTEDSAIVQAILALARSLRMRVVAEGIETSEHREALQQMGCDFGQGYLFSRPLSVQAFSQLLDQQRGPRPLTDPSMI